MHPSTAWARQSASDEFNSSPMPYRVALIFPRKTSHGTPYWSDDEIRVAIVLASPPRSLPCFAMVQKISIGLHRSSCGASALPSSQKQTVTYISIPAMPRLLVTLGRTSGRCLRSGSRYIRPPKIDGGERSEHATKNCEAHVVGCCGDYIRDGKC